jgi:hypothetical protein
MELTETPLPSYFFVLPSDKEYRCPMCKLLWHKIPHCPECLVKFEPKDHLNYRVPRNRT